MAKKKCRQAGRKKNVAARILNPTAMESRMVRPSGQVPETPMRPIYQRSLLFSLLEANNASGSPIGTLTPKDLAILDARQASGATNPVTTAVRFNQLRMRSIEVWGGDGNLGSEVSPSTSVSLTVTESTNNVTGGDGAIFRDFGTLGNTRANIKVIPNFAQRQEWLSTLADSEGNSFLYEVRTAQLNVFAEDVAQEILVRVVMDMR